MIKGQDWSSHQSSAPSVAGLDFVVIKATEGTSYVNPDMVDQARHARAHRLVVGFYHFLTPGNPRGQAAHFVRRAASVPGDPLFVDWETGPDGRAATCAEKDAFIREVQRLRGADHRVGLYCNRDFWLNRDTTSFAGDALWIAEYGVTPGKPRIEAPWLFHQYSSTPVDKNVAAFPSKAALQEWCGRFGDEHQDDEHQEVTEVKLSDQVDLGEWIPGKWPDDDGLKDGRIAVRTALGSTYGHARATHDGVDELRAEVADLRGMLAQVLRAVSG